MGFKAQWLLLTKRKECYITFFIIMLIAIGVFAFHCVQMYGLDQTELISADKLFLGREDSFVSLKILYLIFPLLVVLPFADSYIVDRKAYVTPALASRQSGRQYYFSKMGMVALSAGLMVFLPLLVNMLLGRITFPRESVRTSLYEGYSGLAFYYGIDMKQALFPELILKNPYLYNLLFLLLLTFFCMLCAILVYQFSYFVPRNRILVLSIFFIVNNFFMIFEYIIADLNISLFSYLFPMSFADDKQPWFLGVLFGGMILLNGILIPFGLRRLHGFGGTEA